MTQVRHDNLADALLLVVSAYSSQSAAELRYRALAGKKRMVECWHRGGIVALLPRLEFAAVDIVFAHASAKAYAAQAARSAECAWTPARAGQTKRTQFRKAVLDHAASRFVLCAGDMCKEVVKFVRRLRDIAAESVLESRYLTTVSSLPRQVASSNRVGAFPWAMKLQSLTVQGGEC